MFQDTTYTEIYLEISQRVLRKSQKNCLSLYKREVKTIRGFFGMLKYMGNIVK